MNTKDAFLVAELIKLQHRSIRLHALIIAGLVILGAVVIFMADSVFETLLSEDVVVRLNQIGGTFIASLSAFQGKELVNYWQKANMLKTLENLIRQPGGAQDIVDEAMRDRIHAMLLQSVEKIVVG